jgi:hypothetical protein
MKIEQSIVEPIDNKDPSLSIKNIIKMINIGGPPIGSVHYYKEDLKLNITRVFFFKGSCYTAYSFGINYSPQNINDEEKQEQFARLLALTMVLQMVPGWTTSGKDEEYLSKIGNCPEVKDGVYFILRTVGQTLFSMVNESPGMIALDNFVGFLDDENIKED